VPVRNIRSIFVGAVEQPWPDVRRIAVLRGGGLGDLLMAVPAMEALEAAYPDAELVLLCPPPLVGLLTGRPSPVTRALPLPPTPGVYDPVTDGGDRLTGNPVREWAQDHPIDLGVQLHGGGASSNPFIKSLSPTWTVGTRAEDAEPLTRCIPYRLYQHEVLRWLEVVGLAGAAPVTFEPSVAVTDADRQSAQRVLPWRSGPVVGVHPGARDARRRWPAAHFATVVTDCVKGGARAVILGTPSEEGLMRDIAERARAELSPSEADAIVLLCGLDYPGLCGVLARCDVLVGNDSGVRHLAKAVGTPTVGIFLPSNLIHYGPFGRSRDRVLMSWTTRCPVCDRDCMSANAPGCDHDVSFVADISPDAVLHEVRDLLG
jgi:ADP-heptose:LPS heptosyltransferase